MFNWLVWGWVGWHENEKKNSIIDGLDAFHVSIIIPYYKFRLGEKEGE